MNIEISIPHGSYPASIRDSVTARLSELDRFDVRTQHLRAILDKDNSDHRVELIATPHHGPVLVVDSKSNSMGKALDDAVHKMGRA
ncbi:MAG: HPF/RaiA family ribosome-associated protein, partial [Planctomycetota bacterium]